MYYHEKDLRDPITPAQQAIFDRGHDVGGLAHQLFPGGVNLEEKYGFDYAKSMAECKQLLKQDDAIIYEAAFVHNEVLNLMDILVKKDGKLYAYEVKSSTSVKEVNIYDAAVQYWVMSNAGYRPEDISIVFINNEYVKMGDIDVAQLFTIQSVLDEILPLQDDIAKMIEEYKAVVNSNINPEIKIGGHCFEPYGCDFHGHCWSHLPEYSIMDISGLWTSKKMQLIEQDIFSFEDIPTDFRLSDKEKQQVECELEQKSVIEKDAIKEFVDSLQYPLYFMDFETINPVVPLFDNSRPYQMIPYQYSLHLLESKDAELRHMEFLAEAKEGLDPRIPFIEKLIADLGTSGDILVYNIGFEKGKLNDIAKQFPQYEEQIEKIILRLEDLMKPFFNRHYYTPEMRGSYSIKQVLPALVPSMSYSELEIAEGGQASNAFVALYSETDPAKTKQVRENLLEYCKMDTLAMVEILRVLELMQIEPVY